MHKMSQRFGNKDLPHTIRKQVQEIKQNPEESIDEFAERVQELATDGYNEASENIAEMMTVDAFLKGLSDKQVALSAMEKAASR